MSAGFDRADDTRADDTRADDTRADDTDVDDAPGGAAADWSTLAPPTAEELVVVVGPTASGKTELAVRLAERFGGEVVSADSVQIYREFDVGSGKPSAEERARVRHHLVDALDPHDAADAQRFAQMAGEAIADIRGRGRTPIVCGGTFLWVKALVWGLAPAPPGDEGIRLRHKTFAEREGRPALHAQLAAVDPESAARLAPNDMVRVSRALEIYELTGKPQSAWHAAHGFQERRHAARLVGVSRERDELERRIHVRVREFLSHGWVEEVRGLLTRGYGSARAMGSVGYKQVREHVEGRLSAGALEEAAVRATRVFVRRQRTWLRDLDVSYVRM
ncbi:tRNA (adenosine(37)-N6)-dimethylallyltransferase MiaA [Chondromyces apiculatus]|uniref:tRNA dimethylallyltransferase n=1 Tax=Chondromyces apiculatus DSM 436 TaxID=1192034 RepID=A0A017SZ06_9BACT|nr:tRNA (adenosine(37)-N6)-dimethylallyltransferase MiaA [Chondromyces apiculatus]EYF02188.1 tRNA dimethylallyltransferase [Chondromyces apiculatus DSM 436]